MTRVLTCLFGCIVLAVVLSIGGNAQVESEITPPKLISIPDSLFNKAYGGLIIIVTVNANGDVARVERVVGPGSVCSQVTRPDIVEIRDAAKVAALGARFEPATQNGEPRESLFQITFSGTELPPKVEEGTNYTAANRAAATPPKDAEQTNSKTPKDQNRYTIKGDPNSTVYPPDYKGPVNTIGSGGGQGLTIGTANVATSSAPSAISGGKSLSGGVLNGKALALPKPSFPAAAKAVRASGAVSVQVLIDENGEVFSARAVSGHPLFRSASTTAACGARFSPTKLEGQPVSVSGIITYNFVL